MKSTLQYLLASILATASTLFTATAIAAASTPAAIVPDPVSRIAEENVQADAALVDLATATLAKYGEAAFPAAMSAQLSTLSALCRGVDVARINQRKPAPEQSAPRMQATNLRMLKVNHPLCKRLTATAI